MTGISQRKVSGPCFAAEIDRPNSGRGVNLAGPTGTGYSYTKVVNGQTVNTGQVMAVSDSVSGEDIVYQYDELKRLTQAAATPKSGSSVRCGRRRMGLMDSGT
jgi:hypothetical protein